MKTHACTWVQLKYKVEYKFYNLWETLASILKCLYRCISDYLHISDDICILKLDTDQTRYIFLKPDQILETMIVFWIWGVGMVDKMMTIIKWCCPAMKWWFLVRFQHLSLFVYFRRIICWRRQFLVAWNDAWFCLTSYAGSINNRRAPVFIYQNTSLLLFAAACRTHFVAIIAWNAKLGEKWANCQLRGKLGWSGTAGEGQVGHLMLESRWGNNS